MSIENMRTEIENQRNELEELLQNTLNYVRENKFFAGGEYIKDTYSTALLRATELMKDAETELEKHQNTRHKLLIENTIEEAENYVYGIAKHGIARNAFLFASAMKIWEVLSDIDFALVDLQAETTG